MDSNSVESLLRRITPRRAIEGVAAILLPYTPKGKPDFESFARLLEFTLRHGLRPAVNMDTGYVQLLSREEREQVLALTQQVVKGRPYVAGVYLEPDEAQPIVAYVRQATAIRARGGLPILFQAPFFKGGTTREIVEVFESVAVECDMFLAFELGERFSPSGEIYSLDLVREIMQIRQVQGLKHSSLDRQKEWDRLAMRDQLRPSFKIYTGNDLAIDMVMFGSDYLLGLATFAPDLFALRDRYWCAGDPRFFALNDRLQYLGSFAFRDPTPAYRHSAAQFLRIRGIIQSAEPHPRCPQRPPSDVSILQELAVRVESWL